VREQRVVLEHVPDRPLLRRAIHPARLVEPHLVAERDSAAIGPREAGNRPQDGRLPGPRRPDERDRLAADLERDF
jgi:hypothetical protein